MAPCHAARPQYNAACLDATQPSTLSRTPVCVWFMDARFLVKKLKIFEDYSSHRILRHMYEILNINKNKN